MDYHKRNLVISRNEQNDCNKGGCCPYCNGTGEWWQPNGPDDYDIEQCEECDGKGTR